MGINRTLCSVVLTKNTRRFCMPVNFMQIYTPSQRVTSSSNNNNCGLNANHHQTSMHKHRSSYARRNLAPSSHNYTTALSNMTKDQANDLVFRLNDQERQLLLQVLTQYQANHNRAQIEVEQTPQPTSNDLFKLCVINSLPFIGFGFLDNFTMIIAGDYIEHSIGCVITISTMAAAALGNTISDVLGIGSAYYVERCAEKVGVKPPSLTPIQLEMPRSRRMANIGRVLGITIGCLLGMCPLLFMKEQPKQKSSVTDVTVSAVADDEVATSTVTAN